MWLKDLPLDIAEFVLFLCHGHRRLIASRQYKYWQSGYQTGPSDCCWLYRFASELARWPRCTSGGMPASKQETPEI